MLNAKDARIEMYFHCKTCLVIDENGIHDKGEHLAIGWTKEGLQVVCEGCGNEVVDLDFYGQKVSYRNKSETPQERAEVMIIKDNFYKGHGAEKKIWVISDTHFNHKKMIEAERRPADFNEVIIKNWNKKVAPNDIVIHLGDVILGRNSELADIMERLNGIKILVRGNHDGNKAKWWYERGFSFVCDNFVHSRIAFSHAPLTPLPNQNRDRYQEQVLLNVHGHLHKGEHRGNAWQKDDYFDVDYYLANKDKYHLIQIEDTLDLVGLDDIKLQHGIK